MMIAELKRLADQAEPTEFHRLMKDLDNANKLFRIYTQVSWEGRIHNVACTKLQTQNIDALEAKVGLSYGLGEWKQQSVVRSNGNGGGTGSSTPVKKGSKGKERAVDQEIIPLTEQLSADLEVVAQIATETQEPATVLAGDYENELPSLNEPLNLSISEEPIASTSTLPADEGWQLPPTSSNKQSTMVVDDSQIVIQVRQPSVDGEMPPSSLATSVDMVADPSTESALTDLGQLSFALEDEDIDSPAMAPDTQVAGSGNDNAPRKTVTRRYLTVPQVIPLHGTLEEMHCPKCNHTEAVQPHVEVLASGQTIFCPQCTSVHHSRSAMGERARGIGVMKVSVVLYGEEHKQAARVGEIAEKDLLKAARPDFLIVAGTTLKIPGVKKMVKELAKVIQSGTASEIMPDTVTGEDPKSIHLQSSHPPGAVEKKWEPRVIFVNNEAPNPESTWNSVFDTFVQGDIQAFANAVRVALGAVKAGGLPFQLTQQINTASLAPLKYKGPPSPRTINNFFGAAKGGKQALAGQTHKKLGPGKVKLILTYKANSQPSAKRNLIKKKPANKAAKKGIRKASPVMPVQVVAPPPSPKKVKPKTRPGWKGYAVEIYDPFAKKKDFFTVDPNENLGRRRAGRANQAPPPPPVQSSKSQVTNARSSRQDNVAAAVLHVSGLTPEALRAHLLSIVTRTEDDVAILQTVSAGPSTASTPPPLASEISTVSDTEEAASVKGEPLCAAEYSLASIVPDSQEVFHPHQQQIDRTSAAAARQSSNHHAVLVGKSSSSTNVVEDSQPPACRRSNPSPKIGNFPLDQSGSRLHLPNTVESSPAQGRPYSDVETEDGTIDTDVETSLRLSFLGRRGLNLDDSSSPSITGDDEMHGDDARPTHPLAFSRKRAKVAFAHRSPSSNKLHTFTTAVHRSAVPTA